MTTSLDSTLADQPKDAAGIDPVTEPMYYSGSTADNTVTEQHRQQPKNPTRDSLVGYFYCFTCFL